MAATSLLLFACSQPQDPSILAIVAQSPITVADLRAIEPDDPPGVDAEERFERLREDLQTLVDRELLLIASRDQGLDTGEVVVSRLERSEEVRLARTAMGVAVGERISVTRAEIAEVYEAGWNERLEALEIFVPTGAEADGAVQRLEAGESFADVAAEFAVDPVVRVPSGGPRKAAYLPFESPRALVEILFGLQPGQRTPPIAVAGGFVVAKVTARDSLALEELVNPLRKQLEKEKAQVFRARYLRRLRKEISLQDDSTGLSMAVEVLRNGTPVSDLVREQLDHPVYRSSDFVVDVEEAVEALRAGRRTWKSSATRPAVIQAIRDQILTARVLAWDGRRLGADRTEEFQAWRNRELEKQMITRLRERLLADSVAVTEEDVQAHYEATKHRFRIPAAALVAEILVVEPDLAHRLRKRLEEGEDIEGLASRFTIRGADRNEGARTRFWVYDLQTPIYSEEWMRAVFGTPLHQVTGPLLTKGGYSVFQVLDRRGEEYHPLELPRVREGVTREVREMEGRRVFNQYVKRLRRQYSSSVAIYEDNLRALGSGRDNALASSP